MAAADAANSGSPSQAEQLTAPPGWTKKLVPAKTKYITLRKHDVVFIAPDGQEIPSQWHLRRYLKAHPEGPALSEFIWSSGEESIRRSARATKEISYSEKRTLKGKGKRNASEMDAEGAEEDKVKTPARKRAKKAGKPGDSSVVKGETALPDKDEVMHDVPERAIAGGKLDVQKDEADTGKVLDEKMEEQVSGENPVSATDGVMHEELKVEEVTEHVIEVTEQVVEVMEHVVEVQEQVEEVVTTGNKLQEEVVGATDGVMHKELKVEEVTEHVLEVTEQVVGVMGHVVEVKEQVEEVVTTDNKLQEEVEPKEASRVSPLVAPSLELKGEEPVLESEKPLEPAGESVVESKEPLDQSLQVKEDLHKITIETPVVEEHQEHEKSLEPLMQKEEQERLPSMHNSPLKVEHIGEKSPNELSSSPVPVSVANQ